MKDLTGQDNINKSILNSFGINEETGDILEKAHKYLRKEGKRYIYDYDKMTAKDHRKAAEVHDTKYERHMDNSFGRQLSQKEQDDAEYHWEEKEKHERLAEEKEGKSNDKK